jgi:hypothetical protein
VSTRVRPLPYRRSSTLVRRAVATTFAAAAIVPFLMVLPASAASVFTGGDVVVYRVGTGADPAGTSTSTAVVLDEYAPGTANQAAPALSLALPTTTGTGSEPNPLTASGKAASEGGLTLSSDGTTLLVPGYTAAPGVASIASTAASAAPNVTANTYPREVGEVDASGDIDTTSTLGATAFSGNNPRGATSVNGSAIYVGGAGGSEATQGGVWYTSKGTGTSTQLIGGNWRWASIFNGQLYASSASGTSPAMFGVSSIGSGLPTTGPQTPTPFVDSSTSGTPYGFVLLSEGGGAIDTAYVADTTLGIEKYSLISGTWTAEGTISLPGITGLTGSISGSTVSLFATDPTNLEQVSDTVGTGTLSGTPTILATASAGEVFQGVAFAPSAPPPVTPEVPFALALPLLALGVFGTSAWVIARRRRQRTV